MRQNPPTSLLDQPRFMRFLRLCPKLLGPNLSVAEADGVYQRVKGTSGNRLNMSQFNEEVLPQVSKVVGLQPRGAGLTRGCHALLSFHSTVGHDAIPRSGVSRSSYAHDDV